MKIKLLLLAIYLAFVGVCFVHWRKSEELAATEVRFLEGTRHAAQVAVSEAKTTEEARIVIDRTVRRFDAFAGIANYQAESARSFIYLAIALTLPLAVFVGREIQKEINA